MLTKKTDIAESTIAAIATPIGTGGIGIIRISGDRALDVACHIFRPSSVRFSKPFSLCQKEKIPSHRLFHGHIIQPDGGEVVDEVMLAVMKAPCSYTREDVVEIQSHSGFGVLNTIMFLVLEQNVRVAEPGEFTKRAFLNGRIDLTQAEAIIDLINARSGLSAHAAARQLTNGLNQYLSPIKTALLNILCRMEAYIDFPDDVDDDVDPHLCLIEDTVVKPVRYLLEQYQAFSHFREGLRVTIIGRPNVGKSSLMNLLLRRDRAIVTEIPGTTRDSIEDELFIQDIQVLLVDTAGLHDAFDPVEQQGIERTYQQIDQADLVVFVTDALHAFDSEDIHLLQDIRRKPSLVVVNKVDLIPEEHVLRTQAQYDSLPMIAISVLQKINTDNLTEWLYRHIRSSGMARRSIDVIPNIRHKQALERMLSSLENAKSGLQDGMTIDGIVVDLREALHALGEISGERYDEEIISRIFESFCIGK
ncbi:MAG: tRNA uridine-5-carboxymethylaminomethyl(34) synthesis GTPase MnmE [Desulfatirhabdiaceae bacterium]